MHNDIDYNMKIGSLFGFVLLNSNFFCFCASIIFIIVFPYSIASNVCAKYLYTVTYILNILSTLKVVKV